MLLHHKIELALTAWIVAHRGDLFPGLPMGSIVAGHTNTRPGMPLLAVCCMRAKVHPEFEGCGRHYPQIVPAMLQFSMNANDATHEDTIALWIEQADALLAGDDGQYTAVLAALNPPESGPDTRSQTGLFLYAIHPAEDGGEFDGSVFDEVLALEIVAQNGDPASTAPPTADSTTVTADSTLFTADAA